MLSAGFLTARRASGHFATPNRRRHSDCLSAGIRGKILDKTDRELAGSDMEHSASSVWNVSFGFREVFLAELLPSNTQSGQTQS